MSSALEARPKLAQVKIVRREHEGRIHYIVKEEAEGKFYRFGEAEVTLMQLMNGERSPEEIADLAAESLDGRPAPGQVADFAHKLKRLGLVERTPAEQHLMLMERIRSRRRVRTRQRTRGSILRLRFSIGDPDRLFTRIVERVPWFWSPAFVWGSLALFAVYFALLTARWNEFWAGTVELYTLSGFGLWDYLLLYGIVILVGVIHELGHGLTTKAFGGEVHEIGGMLLYFSPALFCNTNDAWLFKRRSHRLWVTFAGPWIQLVIASLAAIVWILTQPGLIHHAAFLTVLGSGTLAVLMNMNPLLPLDGYYALSDWLEIPNLRPRSFAYWAWLSKRYLLGMDVAEPPVTPRERRVFLLYGGLAFAYSAVIAVVSFFWLVFVVGRFLGPWIWLIVVYLVASLVYRAAGRSQALAAAAATTWRAGFLRGGRTGIALAAAVLIVGLPFVLPWTIRARGEFRVESQPHADLRAGADGVLDRWYVEEGDTVADGQPIATLWNPQLEADVLEQRGRVQRLRLAQAGAENRGDRAAAAAAAAELREAERELAVLKARQSRLTVISPIDGVVLGHRLDEKLGRAVDEGDLLVRIASPVRRYAHVRLPLEEAGEVAPGQSAGLKLFARPDLEFRSTVGSVAPALEDGWLEARVAFPEAQYRPAPGSTGIAKITVRRSTVAGAIARAVQRTIRIDLWL